MTYIRVGSTRTNIRFMTSRNWRVRSMRTKVAFMVVSFGAAGGSGADGVGRGGGGRCGMGVAGHPHERAFQAGGGDLQCGASPAVEQVPGDGVGIGGGDGDPGAVDLDVGDAG